MGRKRIPPEKWIPHPVADTVDPNEPVPLTIAEVTAGMSTEELAAFEKAMAEREAEIDALREKAKQSGLAPRFASGSMEPVLPPPEFYDDEEPIAQPVAAKQGRREQTSRFRWILDPLGRFLLPKRTPS